MITTFISRYGPSNWPITTAYLANPATASRVAFLLVSATPEDHHYQHPVIEQSNGQKETRCLESKILFHHNNVSTQRPNWVDHMDTPIK